MSAVTPIEELPRREARPETAAAMREAGAILRGERPNQETANLAGRGVMGEARFREEAARLVDLGRLVADPVYVKVVELDKIANSLSRFWLWHYDCVPFFTGKRIDMLGQFFHTHLQSRDLPDMYRVMTPRPILATDWGGTLDSSFQAIELGELADLLKRFLCWPGFVRRFTQAQRAEHRERTGRDLLDEYWEVKAHAVTTHAGACVVPLDLYLPSGMDYQMEPLNAPNLPIRFRKTAPDDLVLAAGAQVFAKAYLDVPNRLDLVAAQNRTDQPPLIIRKT